MAAANNKNGQRTNRYYQGLPGKVLEGADLEEWCYSACTDNREWYSPAEKYLSISAANEAIRQSQRLRNPSFKPEIYICEGDTGDGKSLTCAYFNIGWAIQHGGQLAHNGMIGPGMHMEGGQMEWMTAMDRIRVGSLVWIDEGASIVRHGRDSSDLQEFFNQGATGIRKKLAKLGISSAMDYRIGGVIRGAADRFWRPQKIPMTLKPETIKQLKRQLRRLSKITGESAAIYGKHDPRNFAYRLLTTNEKPYRPASVFDPVIKPGVKGAKGSPKGSPTVKIFSQQLSISRLKIASPCLDTFQSVPLGAGLTANRNTLMQYMAGKDGDADGAENVRPPEPIDVLHAIYQGVYSGEIRVAPNTRLRTTELAYALTRITPGMPGALITYTLKNTLGQTERHDGWDITNLVMATLEAFNTDRFAPPKDYVNLLADPED